MLEVLDVQDTARAQTEADAARWKMVEQALIDWRDARDYPAGREGSARCDSFAQHETYDAMRRAVEAALRTLRVEAEAKR